MECKARLRGLYRIISSRTISPRLWNAKPACAGENRAPYSRSRRDATSGAHASGVHPGRDAPAPQGLPRAQGGLWRENKPFARAVQLNPTTERCRIPPALVDRLFIRPSFRSLCGARDSGSVQPCPICRMSRGAKSPGYGLRSPPARTRADYFFKDHSCRSKLASDPGTIFHDRAFICMTTGSSA
jgi:hypothetical protein